MVPASPTLAATENRSLPPLVESNSLYNLTPLANYYEADFNKTVLSYCSKEGKISFASFEDVGTVVTFYRRDIFEAAGFANRIQMQSANWLLPGIIIWQPPSPSKKKLVLNCFAINKANNYGDLLFNMLWSQGLGLYNADGEVTINTAEVVAALEKLGLFWEADVVSNSLESTVAWYTEMNPAMDNSDTPPVASIVIAGWMGNFLKPGSPPTRLGTGV